jgi:hypothetical protein
MLSKEMLRTQSLLLHDRREKQRSTPAGRVGLASEAALHGPWTSINVTLKKTVDWVELKVDRSQVSNPSTGAGTGV